MPLHPQSRVPIKWKRKHTSSPQVQPNTSGIPRAMFDDLLRALLGVPGSLVTVVGRNTCFAQLDTSVGVPGPRDFAVRAGFARPAKPARPSHPAPRFVTIGRNVPRVEAGCGGGWGDFRFSAMLAGCGKVTRRAICAWPRCANCPSCRFCKRIDLGALVRRRPNRRYCSGSFGGTLSMWAMNLKLQTSTALLRSVRRTRWYSSKLESGGQDAVFASK